MPAWGDWQVAPYQHLTERTTQPDGGKAAVGAPCEPQTLATVTTATGEVTTWNPLEGTAAPNVRLAPCVEVAIPVPPEPTPTSVKQ